MKMEPYDPVSCDYHDQLEAAAMHKTQVELEVKEGEAVELLADESRTCSLPRAPRIVHFAL